MSRIAPLSPPYSAALAADFARIMPPGVEPLVLFRTLAVSERAWTKFKGASLLDRGPLPLREREIVIDRTCALNQCEYEWGVHIALFAAKVKLTPEQVAATVWTGADAPCWSPAEQKLLAAVDALQANSTLSDTEFGGLRAHFDDAQILEIILLCGFYRTVAYL